MKAIALFLGLSFFFSLPAQAGKPGDVLARLKSPGRAPTGLAFDGQRLWVADHRDDVLVAMDAGSGKELKRIKSPAYRPAGLAYDGEQLWCADVLEARLYRMLPETGLVSRSIPAPVKVPRALAYDGTALWVSDDASRSIHRVDPEDGTTISEIPFPGKSVDGLSFDGRYLWVSDRLSDMLYAVAPGSGEVVVGLPSPGPHPTGLAHDGERLWVVDYQTDRVTALAVDGEDFILKDQPRRSRVEFSHELRNFGPDALPGADIYLAIPGDEAGQSLSAPPRFEPEPAARLKDQWGQPVAVFHFDDLEAGKTARVRMTAELTAHRLRWVIWPEKVKPLSRLPADIRRRYLGDSPKYRLEDPAIRAAAKEAVGSERNPYWMARRIYRFIHQRMHYEMVGGWDVAPKVLARGSGSCSEYSFVFIALCRAVGLPARYAGSLVVRRDAASYDDVYHRWVEIYLPGYGWVPVDPSRGDKDTEAARAEGFGLITADFLITTHGGGGSKYLGWNYNANEKYSCAGRCKVDVEGIAEWEPLQAETSAPTPR